jgi:hypothetical protein
VTKRYTKRKICREVEVVLQSTALRVSAIQFDGVILKLRIVPKVAQLGSPYCYSESYPIKPSSFYYDSCSHLSMRSSSAHTLPLIGHHVEDFGLGRMRGTYVLGSVRATFSLLDEAGWGAFSPPRLRGPWVAPRPKSTPPSELVLLVLLATVIAGGTGLLWVR